MAVRVCAKCGSENPAPTSSSDVWCTKCGDFLGFPDPVQTAQERRHIRVVFADVPEVVTPGHEAVVTARVANRGTIVEKITLAIDGDIGVWSQAEPAEIGLFPEQDTTVRVLLRPPRSSSVRAGPVTLRLLAVSQSDAAVSDTAEAPLTIGPFVDLRAQLVPQQSAGPSGADHRLVVANDGNAPVDANVAVSEPGDGLLVEIEGPTISIAAGGTGETVVHVAPREPLDGAVDRTHRFAVSVSRPGGQPVVARGSHLQEAPASIPTLVLGETRLHTPPGQEVTTDVTVRNRGRGGETYVFTVLGPAASWARVVPPTITLPSAGEVTAKLVFAPPGHPPVEASDLPFAVRCVAQADPGRRAVAEGALTIDPISVINCEIVASRGRGRWSGRYLVELENQGNSTAEVRAVAVDPSHQLSFALSPSLLRVAAGSRSLVALKARARRPTLLGKARKCGFHLALAPPAGSPRIANGTGATARDVTFEQVSVMPRKLTLLVGLVVAVAGIGVAALAILASTGNSVF